MVAVPVTGAASITLGAPRTLFVLQARMTLVPDEHYTPFDISADDRRFIMARQVEASSSEQLTVLLVENWLAEVKEKLTKK